MKRIGNTLIVVLAAVTVMALGATHANAANKAHLQFFSPFPNWIGDCEYDFDRTAWVGSNPSTSDWTNFVPDFSNCSVTGVRDISFSVSKAPLVAGVGDFDTDIELTVDAPLGVTCVYGGSGSGTWIQLSGQGKYMLPLTPLVKTGGSALCPSGPIHLRSNPNVTDMLADD